VINEGEFISGLSQVFCPYFGADQVRSKIFGQTGRAIYLEAATWSESIRRLNLNGDELFNKFAGPGILELSGGKVESAEDHRRRRRCCFIIGTRHFWSRRLSGRAELRG